MPFPETPRVIYERNPLLEVTCELRFPPILRIDSEAPSRFQEAIRTDYPLYKPSNVAPIAIPPGVPAEVAKLLRRLSATPSSGIRHNFSTEDNKWQTSLTRESLVLRTNAYHRWERFRERLTKLCNELMKEYQPSFYARIGLRYVDVIQRSELGLVDLPWSQLLQPHIAGEFASAEIAENIVSASREFSVKLDDEGGRVVVKHGLALAEPKHEKCYFVDSDFYTATKTETKDAYFKLDKFNRAAARLFRWCIQERLHTALQPKPVDD